MGRVEPSTAWQKMKTKSTKRTMTTKMKGGRRGVEVRRGKNPRQGESLDKGQDRQYNYEQARSTRHAGRPVDL